VNPVSREIRGILFLIEKDMKRERKKSVLIIIVLASLFILFSWLLCSCSKDDEPVTVHKVLLVYLAGDNSLSDESRDNLNVIADGFNGAPDSRILVYRDDYGGAPSMLEISARGKIDLIEQYGEENSADAAVFSRFLSDARSMYPQAGFNLLVFSHATGWLPAGSFSNPKSGTAAKSILMDGREEMEFLHFASAIPDGMFSFIVFDACYMAGIETAYQLKNKTKYIAASSAELLSPGYTPVYGKYINELVDGNSASFIQAAFNYFYNQSGYMRSATLSLIKTEQLDALAAFVRTNCDLEKEVDLGDVQHFDRYGKRYFYDFADYYSLLLASGEKQQELQKLIDNCVVWKASTTDFLREFGGFAIDRHSGMTSYVMQEGYPLLNESYTALGWYKAVRGE
jgi:hypothetical protein